LDGGGDVLQEVLELRELAQRWSVQFTPFLGLLPEEVELGEGQFDKNYKKGQIFGMDQIDIERHSSAFKAVEEGRRRLFSVASEALLSEFVS
jgi:hypothetical protein